MPLGNQAFVTWNDSLHIWGVGGLDGIFVMKGIVMKGVPLPKPPGQKTYQFTLVDWGDIGMTLPLQKTTDELQNGWCVDVTYVTLKLTYRLWKSMVGSDDISLFGN